MEISETTQNDVILLTLSGKMMGGPETYTIHTNIKNLIGEGIYHVVIDLGKLEWLNSAGIGILVSSLSSLRAVGGNLVLANVTGKVKEILNMAHMHLIFEYYDSVDAAISNIRRLKTAKD